MAVISARNNALNVNPPQGAAHLTTGASDWLWAVTAVYAVSFVIFYLLSFTPHNGERIFHYLFTIGLFVGAVAYYAMASDLAFTVIQTSLYQSDAATYQIFFAKYINWVVSFPVVIIALGLISGVSWATISFNIALAWIWIISYLCSAYTGTRYKWGFWAWGTAAYIILAIQTLWYGISCAGRVNLRSHYALLAGWANLLWVLYPIAFAVSDGGNVISVPESFIWYGILDVLLLPVIGFAILLLSRKWDYEHLNLHFTQYGRVAGRKGVFPEKDAEPGTSAPAATPAGQEAVISA